MVLAFAVCVHGQTPDAANAGKLQTQVTLRSRMEAWDWFSAGTTNPYAYLGSILKTQFSRQYTNFDWQVELALPFLLGLPNDAVAAAPQSFLGFGGNYFAANARNDNAAMLFAKQGFVRFRNIGGVKGQSLRLGRFEFNDGSEITPKNATLASLKAARINMRLIGNFAWAHVGRSLDGFHYSLSKPGGTLTFIGAIPTRGAFQVDGWGETRNALSYASYAAPLEKGKSSGELRLFGIYYHDYRHIAKTDNRPAPARLADLANIGIWTWGGHYLQATQTPCGVADFLVWGAAQSGRWGRLDHRAYALDVEAGFQPKVLLRLRPWFRGGYSHSSGDKSPTDTRHETFFQVLPTPRPFARFPFFNLMNNKDAFGILTLRPHKAVTVSSEMHSLHLSSASDQWLQGGGVFQPWTFGYVGRPSNGATSLATLWDVNADWKINARYSLTAYFANAAGKSVVAAIYPRGNTARLFYLEWNMRLF